MRQVLHTTKYQLTKEPRGVNHNKVLFPILKHTSLFNNDFYFNLPQLGYLSQATLKIDLTSDISNNMVEDYIGTKLIKTIQLERFGRRLTGITTLYTNSRIDQLTNNDNILDAISKHFDNSVSWYIPMFLPFIERPLDTTHNTDLQLKVSTIPFEVSNLINVDTFDISLIVRYFTYEYHPMPALQTWCMWDTESPTPIVIPTGSSQLKYHFNTDKNVFGIHFGIQNNEHVYHRITSYEIYVDNTVLTTVYMDGNFEIGSENVARRSSMIGSYYTNPKPQRYQEINPISLRYLDNIYLVLNFANIPSGYSLEVCYEYYKYLRLY